ncbi:LOW QUALITY PROTEIN: matrix metalloproteinase-17 [Neofelis nebulosa]|uniref:LOW QUALITY PROTEIN: matrix metalloproteinase-17 n=1 Tax=Neofelis nebulosa TaxID=61452 RepID=UPI00272B2B7B|nr:LOW QUALITY PROTEIN: matrix metalloproteinase-17 [Neofelis nebulosa]
MGRRAAPGPGPPPPRPRLPPLPLLLLALAARGGCGAPAPRAEDLSLGVEWLSRFGYLPPADPTTGQLQTQEELSKAIAAMQRFGGLEATGILGRSSRGTGDGRSGSLVSPNSPPPPLRALCGGVVRDGSPLSLGAGPRILAMWDPASTPHPWICPRASAEVGTPVSPQSRSGVGPAIPDADRCPPGQGPASGRPDRSRPCRSSHVLRVTPVLVLHTRLALSAGDAHFDDDESWAFRSPDTHDMDLFAVAVHEFGHAIGLSHVAATSSIMQPYYQGPVGDPLHYRLPYEDRVRIWQLYGVRESVSPTAQPDTPEPEEPPLPPEPPNNRSGTPPRKDVPLRCSTDFDAVAQIRGEAFFFKGRYFWRLTRDGHLVSLQPAQMHRFWRGLPLHLDGVDAVFERTSDHKIVFFKGDRYWVFKDNNVEEGYPRPVSDFGLPPGGVDAAFSWAHNDKTYFFKDQLYWRFDEHTRRMDPGHPARSPPWRGIPSTLDDAMRWSDGAAYFFRGKEYWKVVEGELEAAPGYPRSTAQDWLVCTDPQEDPEGEEGEAGARARPGQRGQSRSEDGFEVCSCTSPASPPPGASGPLLAATLLLPLIALWSMAPGTLTAAGLW